MRPVSVQVRRLMLAQEKDRYEDLFEIGRFLEQSGRFDLANKLQREVDLVAQPAVERMLRYEHRPNNKGFVASGGADVPEPVVMQGGQVIPEGKPSTDDDVSEDTTVTRQVQTGHPDADQ